MFLLILMYALFAAEFPLAKFALDNYANAFFLETVRMLIGGILFLGYYIVRSGKKIAIDREDIWIFVQLVIFYMYLSYFCAAWALQYMTSLKANIFSSFMPFVSAVLAYFILRERPTIKRVIGMLLGATGLVVILLTCDSTPTGHHEFARISLPELMMIISIISTEYGYFLLKRLYDKGYPLVVINGAAMFVGGSLSLITGTLLLKDSLFQYSSLWPVLGYALALFLLINVIDNALYGVLIKQYSITFLTLASFLTPVFGLLYGTMFMGETISTLHIVACGLIFLGLFLFSRDELRRKGPPDQVESVL